MAHSCDTSFTYYSVFFSSPYQYIPHPSGRGLFLMRSGV